MDPDASGPDSNEFATQADVSGANRDALGGQPSDPGKRLDEFLTNPTADWPLPDEIPTEKPVLGAENGGRNDPPTTGRPLPGCNQDTVTRKRTKVGLEKQKAEKLKPER